jgi:hypothetical protein
MLNFLKRLLTPRINKNDINFLAPKLSQLDRVAIIDEVNRKFDLQLQYDPDIICFNNERQAKIDALIEEVRRYGV